MLICHLFDVAVLLTSSVRTPGGDSDAQDSAFDCIFLHATATASCATLSQHDLWFALSSLFSLCTMSQVATEAAGVRQRRAVASARGEVREEANKKTPRKWIRFAAPLALACVVLLLWWIRYCAVRAVPWNCCINASHAGTALTVQNWMKKGQPRSSRARSLSVSMTKVSP